MSHRERTHPFGPGAGPIAMAHRGFSRSGLENTLLAFSAAIELGMTYLETDVHATADGELVAFHDHRLSRLTGHPGKVVDLSWAELQSLRVQGQEPIPLLAEVLHSWPEAKVNIDVKAWPAVEPLIRVLRGARALDRVCVTSFDDRRIAAVREQLGPELATSWGPLALRRWWLASTFPVAQSQRWRRKAIGSAVAVQIPPQVAGVPVLTNRSLALAQELGLAVHCWTINDPEHMRALVARGVDGIITDRSDLWLAL